MMPWKEIELMDEKRRFIESMLQGTNTMTEACREFGISRKTGYKWWSRFQAEGMKGLAERSRNAHHMPHKTDEETVMLIVGARRKHPTWGPKKLHAWLSGKGYRSLPAPSTIGRILEREGLVKRKRHYKGRGRYNSGLSEQSDPNAVWGADFKGHFKLGNGNKCYPLTISDGFSRYLLRCDGLLHPGGQETQDVFELVFREFGLPQTIRTDNGTPFSGRYGISKLSVWWIKLGITPERIARGKPTQNGRHERIHKTLKQDVLAHKTRRNLWAQQREFDRFRFEYNEERPHESLGQKPPATFYEASRRSYPTKIREPEYPRPFQTQRATTDGSIVLAKKRFRISAVLKHEPMGLLENEEDGTTEIFYGPLNLGWISASGRLNRGIRPGSSKLTQEETT